LPVGNARPLSALSAIFIVNSTVSTTSEWPAMLGELRFSYQPKNHFS
jgi:hypothetical protein